FSSTARLTSPGEVGSRTPIGRPIANAGAHVLDRGMAPMAPVPIGVPGELYLGGDGLARGYLGRPHLTAARFVPDRSGGGGRLSRTGARVRQRPDGRLDFLGRTDLQVKVAGHRIEPGEIEAVLSRHPWVRESAVVALPAGVAADGSASGDRRLVAYVVPAEGAPRVPEDDSELRSWLRERLPEPFLPRRFAFLDRLPLTANGKVDRA